MGLQDDTTHHSDTQRTGNEEGRQAKEVTYIFDDHVTVD